MGCFVSSSSALLGRPCSAGVPWQEAQETQEAGRQGPVREEHGTHSQSTRHGYNESERPKWARRSNADMHIQCTVCLSVCADIYAYLSAPRHPWSPSPLMTSHSGSRLGVAIASGKLPSTIASNNERASGETKQTNAPRHSHTHIATEQHRNSQQQPTQKAGKQPSKTRERATKDQTIQRMTAKSFAPFYGLFIAC